MIEKSNLYLYQLPKKNAEHVQYQMSQKFMNQNNKKTFADVR